MLCLWDVVLREHPVMFPMADGGHEKVSRSRTDDHAVYCDYTVMLQGAALSRDWVEASSPIVSAPWQLQGCKTRGPALCAGRMS